MTTTTKRPTLAKQHTRKSEENRDAANDQGITLELDGVSYTLRLGDLTAMDSMACRRETGIPAEGVIQALIQSPGIDLIATIVWLARRQNGEPMLPFAAVAADINFDSDFDIVGPAEPEPDEEKV